MKIRYGIAPKFLEQDGKPRIEVFNPCDDSDDQKTQTVILFDNDHKFLGFGSTALQRYAELLDDEGSGLLFQSVFLLKFQIQNLVFFSIKCISCICIQTQDLLMVERCL